MNLYFLTNIYFIKFNICIVLILFLFSCSEVNTKTVQENIVEFIDWTFKESYVKYNEPIAPVSSFTLNSLLVFDEKYSNYEFITKDQNKMNIVGLIAFKSNNSNFSQQNNDLIKLIAKAQNYEKFDIMLQSNRNKIESEIILDKVEERLVIEGVEKDKITRDYSDSKESIMLVKLIKANNN